MGVVAASCRRVGVTVFLIVAAVGMALIWPQTLGGRAAYVRVDGWSMDPTYHNGDLAVVWRQSSYRVGDPVAYKIPKGEFGAGALIIHRLVAGDGVHGFVTRGDNRTIVDPWHPRTSDIVGAVQFDVPRAGTVVSELTRPAYVGGLVGFLTFAVMVVPSRAKRTRRRVGKHAVAPNGLVTGG